MRRPAAALSLIAASTLALTACGDSTVDTEKGETFIRGVVAEQVGARVATVTCPDDVKTDKGDTFTCSVAGADGSKGDVLVTQRDDKGNVNVSAPFLHVREAEAVMADQIAKQAKLEGVTVKCPEIIVVKTGERFACKATAEGRSRDVAARLTDDDGHFTYRLSRAEPS